MTDEHWLGTTNIYGVAAAEKLTRDKKAKRAPNARNLGQYVAASAPLHALDGWAYVARSLDAAVKGDPDAARHLAYYAELRAALSLLAAQGIGIFNRVHAVVEPAGDARVFGGHPTHVMTWLALRYWMRSPESAVVIGDVVAQGGETIDTWIGNLPRGGPWKALGSRWLESWGVDLRDAVHDRGARNRASYGPTRLYNTRPIGASETKAFIRQWWDVLEPTTGGAFEILDRHLLRASFEQAFAATTGSTPEDAPERYRQELAQAKGATTGDSSLDDSLGLFLTREHQEHTAPLLEHASTHDPPNHPLQHFQVISRATLLLRLASGAASELLIRAGLTASQIAFWTEGIGEDRGLWAPGVQPEELTDLWADVETALDDLDASEPPTLPSYKRFHELCGQAFPVLAGAERVALWGVGL